MSWLVHVGQVSIACVSSLRRGQERLRCHCVGSLSGLSGFSLCRPESSSLLHTLCACGLWEDEGSIACSADDAHRKMREWARARQPTWRSGRWAVQLVSPCPGLLHMPIALLVAHTTHCSCSESAPILGRRASRTDLQVPCLLPSLSAARSSGGCGHAMAIAPLLLDVDLAQPSLITGPLFAHFAQSTPQKRPPLCGRGGGRAKVRLGVVVRAETGT